MRRNFADQMSCLLIHFISLEAFNEQLSPALFICVALRSKRDLNISKIYQKRSIFRLDKGIKLHLCLEAFVVEISRIQESGSGGLAGLSKNLA